MFYNSGVKVSIHSAADMQDFGEKLAHKLPGGSVVELIGDVGAGKTTLVKGIGRGLGVAENIQSPSYTIFCRYDGEKLALHHYDFYRLQDPGLVSYDLEESLNTPNTITVVEWADNVQGVLPTEHITIRLQQTGEDDRELEIEGIQL